MSAARDRRHPGRGPDAGFTLTELLISMTIMLAVMGAVFAIVDPSHTTSRAQPEVADMQQRMRIATDQLSKDLIMAGAGTYSGAIAGGLANFFAPIMPFATGALFPNEALDRFHPDRITIIYVPNTASQTTVKEPMPQPSSEIKVNAEPGCPADDQLCGFAEGMRCLIFDDTGAVDLFTITEVQAAALHLQHAPPNPDFSKKYDPVDNARIAQVATHTYFIDHNTNQLMHYSGWDEPPVPIVDNVVGLQFQYFGEPTPPAAPRPAPGKANCIYDDAGNPLLPTLPSDGSSLVALPPDLFKQGIVCGAGPMQFDADLYRVKRVRVTVRIQAPNDLRGTDPFLFLNPGQSTGGGRHVPDYQLSFEIAPRNMNFNR